MIEHSGARAITLEGDLSIRRACELKDLLLTALKEGRQVVLEFGEYVGSDLSLLQLLCSAHRTAARLGISLTFGDTVPADFRKTTEQAGYLRDKGCVCGNAATCLWLRSRNG